MTKKDTKNRGRRLKGRSRVVLQPGEKPIIAPKKAPREKE